MPTAYPFLGSFTPKILKGAAQYDWMPPWKGIEANTSALKNPALRLNPKGKSLL